MRLASFDPNFCHQSLNLFSLLKLSYASKRYFVLVFTLLVFTYVFACWKCNKVWVMRSPLCFLLANQFQVDEREPTRTPKTQGLEDPFSGRGGGGICNWNDKPQRFPFFKKRKANKVAEKNGLDKISDYLDYFVTMLFFFFHSVLLILTSWLPKGKANYWFLYVWFIELPRFKLSRSWQFILNSSKFSKLDWIDRLLSQFAFFFVLSFILIVFWMYIIK